MKGFRDIEGTEICEGDKVLFADTWANSAPILRNGYKVVGFTPKFVKLEAMEGTLVHGRWDDKIKIAMHRTNIRILVLKGEFKEYTKTKDFKNGS
jgi:hypothetical protein